ncbi:uncharacterized protein METZ01_LOCUS351477, partial [marine metagenome]
VFVQKIARCAVVVEFAKAIVVLLIWCC